MTFFSLYVFFMTLNICRGIDQISCRMSPDLSLSGVFLMIRWGYGLEGDDHRGKLLFSSHHIRAHAVTVTDCCDVGLDPPAEVCLSGRFYKKYCCKRKTWMR